GVAEPQPANVRRVRRRRLAQRRQARGGLMAAQPIRRYLERVLELDASDVYLTVDSPPVFRVEGIATPADDPPLTMADTAALAAEAMSEERQREEFARGKEMNLALSLSDAGRFRCNIFQ